MLILFFIYFKDPNPDPDIRWILQFLEGYPTPGYPRTPDPDKDSKIMDSLDKDPDLDTLKLPRYPIRSRPTINCFCLCVFICVKKKCVSFNSAET